MAKKKLPESEDGISSGTLLTGLPDELLKLMDMNVSRRTRTGNEARKIRFQVPMTDLLAITPDEKESKSEAAGLLVKYKFLWDVWVWQRRRLRKLKAKYQIWRAERYRILARMEYRLGTTKLDYLLSGEKGWMEWMDKIDDCEERCNLLQGAVRAMEMKCKHVLLYGNKPEMKDMADALDMGLEGLLEADETKGLPQPPTPKEIKDEND